MESFCLPRGLPLWKPRLSPPCRSIASAFLAPNCCPLHPLPHSCRFQVVIGLAVLVFGQDLPDGNYAALRRSGAKDKAKTHRETLAAMKNYRTWLLVLTYGYCFGVELTVDNNMANYLYDQFGLSLNLAGTLGAVFGLSNLFARALGGIASDFAARHYGMRGRIWTLWILQSLGARGGSAGACLLSACCLLLLLLTRHPASAQTLCCRFLMAPPPHPRSVCLRPAGGMCSILMYYVSSSLTNTMVVVAFWSIFVPAACGATYGIAPFITRRGLGVATGLIGAGGNAGSAITQAAFFTSSAMSLSEGFQWMVSPARERV